jgi:hypothetical protein
MAWVGARRDEVLVTRDVDDTLVDGAVGTGEGAGFGEVGVTGDVDPPELTTQLDTLADAVLQESRPLHSR